MDLPTAAAGNHKVGKPKAKARSGVRALANWIREMGLNPET